jgi:hypothetical protein
MVTKKIIATLLFPIYTHGQAIFTEFKDSLVVTPEHLDSTRHLAVGKRGLVAPYLVLIYDFSAIKEVEWLYSEILIPQGEAPPPTYFCVLGGFGFYSGIQILTPTEKRIIFSVWDDQDGKDYKNLVKEERRAYLIEKNENLIYNRFGGEGSGIHSHMLFDWQENSTYKFLAHIVPDSTTNSTDYSLFFHRNDEWELIAKIRRPKNFVHLGGAYSFLEDVSKRGDLNRRAAYFNNQWVRTKNGKWFEIANASFDVQHLKESKRKLHDYGCRLSPQNGFLLVSGGGYTGYYLPPRSYLTRQSNNRPPLETMPK